MIIEVQPRPAYQYLDLIIEEQAEYYGAHNSHVIAYMRHKMRGGLA